MDTNDIFISYETNEFKKYYLSTCSKYEKVIDEYQKLSTKLRSAQAADDLINSIVSSHEKATELYKRFVKNPDFDYQNRKLKAIQFTLQQDKKRIAFILKETTF